MARRAPATHGAPAQRHNDSPIYIPAHHEVLVLCTLQGRHWRYALRMSWDRASESPTRLWKPHPDDAADVREAMASADRGELLSPAASEAFLMWTQGNGDESWRDELE